KGLIIAVTSFISGSPLRIRLPTILRGTTDTVTQWSKNVYVDKRQSPICTHHANSKKCNKNNTL
ncbi:MAG TPA: hypothetical protein VF268_03760, partial [Gammaproteobacteria bacterium]